MRKRPGLGVLSSGRGPVHLPTSLLVGGWGPTLCQHPPPSASLPSQCPLPLTPGVTLLSAGLRSRKSCPFPPPVQSCRVPPLSAETEAQAVSEFQRAGGEHACARTHVHV